MSSQALLIFADMHFSQGSFLNDVFQASLHNEETIFCCGAYIINSIILAATQIAAAATAFKVNDLVSVIWKQGKEDSLM